MIDTLYGFGFATYPYLCLAVFLLGSLIRFDREQYTWRSGSSQLLRARPVSTGVLFTTPRNACIATFLTILLWSSGTFTVANTRRSLSKSLMLLDIVNCGFANYG